MKKLLLACIAMFACFGLFAQKSVYVAVCENFALPMPAENDYRTGKLLQEYLKSEIATHSGISVNQIDTTSENVFAKNGMRRGVEPKVEQIKAVCKEIKVDYLCMLSVSRGKNSVLIASVVIYDKNGIKNKTVITREFKDVCKADGAGLLLSKDVATAIRGRNPIDDIMVDRYNKESDKNKKDAENTKDSTRAVSLDEVKKRLNAIEAEKAKETKKETDVKKAAEAKPAEADKAAPKK